MSKLSVSQIIETDVLVVGGGGAATRAALSAAQMGASVRMAVKSKWLRSGSTATAFSELLAIAAAIGHEDERDEPEVHYEDTLDAGRGFIDPELVWTLASEMPDRIQDLINMGLNFDKQENGKLVQGMSDFATYPRTCRVNGVTARHILTTLSKQLKKYQTPVDEYTMIYKILTGKEGEVLGALGVHKQTNEIVLYKTPTIILACGGAHHIYKYAVGTPDMTGNGYAMAYELGVPLVNMEFVQIGPAAIQPSITLLSGPVWKAKPILTNNKGKQILENYIPKNISLEEVYRSKVFPFTISSPAFYLDTAIQRELETNPSRNGGVWCTMSEETKEIVEEKMPKTKGILKSKGINIFEDKFEVALVAQCMNGGALIETPNGETKVKGLYAAGETAGGVRGPDRPGGNSLAEGQVFGNRTGKAAASYAKSLTESVFNEEQDLQEGLDELNKLIKNGNGEKDLDNAIQSLKESMYRNCLVMRNKERLDEVLKKIDSLHYELETGEFNITNENVFDAIDLKHMLLVSRSIVLSALTRKESRSCHYREDFPNKDNVKWVKSVVISKQGETMDVHTRKWPSHRELEKKGTI
ncbi:FAD-binding protein [Thalassobacillus devorans]|uniref:FAD-binding protein n=1 Tax=Thalassobacillus devorans TaxID=279813 RepID=UPI000A1CEA38|nr:FAD-binding protein [Thalassobacillus devorans]